MQMVGPTARDVYLIGLREPGISIFRCCPVMLNAPGAGDQSCARQSAGTFKRMCHGI